MVSDIELELAMSVIQLTGVSIPILLGIVRYYFNNPDSIESRLESHDEVLEGATLGGFLAPIAGTLFVSYLSAFALISLSTSLLLTISLAAYGAFLLLLSIPVVVGLGGSVSQYTKKIWVGFIALITIGFLVLVLVGVLVGSQATTIRYGFSLIIFLLGCYILYRWLIKKEDEYEVDSDDNDVSESGSDETEVESNDSD